MEVLKSMMTGIKEDTDMNKGFYILAALAVLASCSAIESDIVTPQEEENLVTVTVGVEMSDPATKVVIGDDGVNKTLKWKDGDVISIGLRNKSTSATSQLNTTVNVVGDNALVTFSYDPAVYDITDARYPQGGTNATIPTTQYMWRGDIILPLTAGYDGSQSIISFAPTVGSEYTIINYRLKEGNTAKTLEAIEVTFNGGTKYTLDTKTQMGPGKTNVGIALTDTPQDFYVVIPSGADPHALKAVFKMSDGTQYTRTKATFTPTEKRLHIMPIISDVDDTGRYTWIFKGEEGPDGNLLSQNAPFTYWFRPQADRFATINRGADYWTQTAWVQDAGNFKYRFGFAPTLNDSNQGKSSSEWGTIAESKTTINDTPNQVMRFPVHVGNYPIFAVKITKLGNLGNSRSFKLDVNSILAENQTGNEFIGRSMPVKYWDSTTSKTTLEETDTYGIYYFDLSSSSITFKYGDGSSRTQLPNSRTLHFTTWQIQIPDVKFDAAQDPLPTCNIYWAGFFNSVTELTSFAASH